ncbi:MAG: hypothetical protein ACK4M7_07435, partial [Burkholderiales bacterium]
PANFLDLYSWQAIFRKQGKEIAQATFVMNWAECLNFSKNNDLKAYASLYHSLSNWQPPSFPLKGNDLLHLGLKPGPHIKKILNYLEEEWEKSYYRLSTNELLTLIDKQSFNN